MKPTALVKDFVSRELHGETDCQLCDITYGRFVKKPQWRSFLKALPVPAHFYMKDEFRKKFAHDADAIAEQLPAVFAQIDDKLIVKIPAEDFQTIGNLDKLETRVREIIDNG